MITASDILTLENIDEIEDIFDDVDDVVCCDYNQARRACSFLSQADIEGLIQAGNDLDQILEFDAIAGREYQKISRSAEREFREVWAERTDAYDLVDVAHSDGVALSDYDNIARRLGMGWNWTEGASRRLAYKKKKRVPRAVAVEIIPAAPAAIKSTFGKKIDLSNLAATAAALAPIGARKQARISACYRGEARSAWL